MSRQKEHLAKPDAEDVQASKTGKRKPGRRRKGMCLEDRPVLEADAAGIDIGAREIFVAVPPNRDENPVRVFATFTEDLEAMVRWLVNCGITTVAIAYASHCTSLGRCDTFSTCKSLFDNLTPLALCGGLGPGSS
jgi:hypothetical protein